MLVILSEAKDLCILLARAKSRSFASLRMTSVKGQHEDSPVCPSPPSGVKLKVANIRANVNFKDPSWKGSPMATMEAPPRLQVRLHEGAFKNESFVDFTKEDNVRKMRSAIEKVRGQLGREYDLIIGGKRLKTSAKIRSINPAKPSEVVGTITKPHAGTGQPGGGKRACVPFPPNGAARPPKSESAWLVEPRPYLLPDAKWNSMAWLVTSPRQELARG